MNLIEQQPHFWELYQNHDQYYLSIAVDMSSVVSCWDIRLADDVAEYYKNKGRIAIEELADRIVKESYCGDFSLLEQLSASPEDKQAMQQAFMLWKKG